MHKKFEVNWTKIKGCCQSGRKVITHDSKSDLPLALSASEKNTHMHEVVFYATRIQCKSRGYVIRNIGGNKSYFSHPYFLSTRSLVHCITSTEVLLCAIRYEYEFNHFNFQFFSDYILPNF